MEDPMEMPQEFFDEIFYDAVEDLRKCGLEDEEILNIIEEHLGAQYARKLFKTDNNLLTISECNNA